MRMFKKMSRREKIRWVLFSVCPGFAAGILWRLGSILEAGGSVWLINDGNILSLLGLCLLFSALTATLLLAFAGKGAEREKREVQEFQKKWFLILWALLFLCWIPTFLAYYPTLWTYDVENQLPAIRNRPLTTHQPLLHTLYIQTVVQIGSRPGDYEIGMVLLSLSQMVGMAGILAYAIEFTRKWGLGRWGRTLLFLFAAFFPVNSILSISMTKDVFFSGCFLICCLKIYDMTDEPETFFASKKKVISLVFFICMMLLLRSNGIYVFAVWLPLALWIIGKKWRKKIAVLGAVCLCAYSGLHAGLFYASGAEKGSELEAYCVPMQCLIGVAIRHPELVPEKGKGEILMGVVPRDLFHENVADNLDPQLADPIKTCFSLADNVDGAALLKTWAAYGLKYPMDYVDVWGNLTLGAWYPMNKTHANIYHREGGRQVGYLLTDYKYIHEMEMERPESKWPALEQLYEKIATENVHQDIPGLSLLFAPAAYCWIAAFYMILALYQKRYRELISLGLLFLYWGTVMLGPTILVRYLYPVILTVPFVICRFHCFSLNNTRESDTIS